MDNDAFRALIEERAKIKSTKEIAREAVEDEFRKRKKRKWGGSSSEESDGSDADQDEPHRDLLTPVVVAQKKARSNESKYRDRAKERREGKNLDYEADASLLEGVTDGGVTDERDMDRVTMSKYLGGDEAHTHLVKGLDVTLARRVKRELGKETTDVDVGVLPTCTKVKKKHVVRDADEARLLLQRINTKSIPSELGRQILSHLRGVHLPSRPLSQLHVSTSPSGIAIQCSTITFATLGDLRDRNRAWEVPFESSQAVSHTDVGATGEETSGATPVDAVLLQQIKHALTPKGQEQKSLAYDTGRQNGIGGALKKIKEQPDTVGADAGESDDDIFAGIDDYVPPTQASESNRAVPVGDGLDRQSIEAHDSIFSGLGAPKKHQPLSGRAVQKSAIDVSKRSVISRDILGSQVASKTASTVVGISVSSYQGGYGEEMDVDFDGRFAAEEADDGKKRRKEETTLAALEYGTGRRKMK